MLTIVRLGFARAFESSHAGGVLPGTAKELLIVDVEGGKLSVNGTMMRCGTETKRGARTRGCAGPGRYHDARPCKEQLERGLLSTCTGIQVAPIEHTICRQGTTFSSLDTVIDIVLPTE